MGATGLWDRRLTAVAEQGETGAPRAQSLFQPLPSGTKKMAMICDKGQGNVKFLDPVQSHLQEHNQRKKNGQCRNITATVIMLGASTAPKGRTKAEHSTQVKIQRL